MTYRGGTEFDLLLRSVLRCEGIYNLDRRVVWGEAMTVGGEAGNAVATAMTWMVSRKSTKAGAISRDHRPRTRGLLSRDGGVAVKGSTLRRVCSRTVQDGYQVQSDCITGLHEQDLEGLLSPRECIGGQCNCLGRYLRVKEKQGARRGIKAK